eukprot:COSAG05_NODE_5408_length_1184_cov_1.495853_2_plen_72_part_00
MERTDASNGGFSFDATGDGTADDVFVANEGQANVVVVWWTCRRDGYAIFQGRCGKITCCLGLDIHVHGYHE